MFQNSGLSLEQAPPIDVVLRLFFIGSLFGIVLSIMIFFWHNDLSNISASTTLSIVHTFTIGVMSSFMLGALFQMMPVLCGVHIKTPIELSIRVTFLLSVGLIFLIVAFLKGINSLYIFASIFLSLGLFISIFFIVKELIKIKHSISSKGMLLAVLSLFVATSFAILMLFIRADFDIPADYMILKSIHISFAVFGWIVTLVISVSFQVIEMFYVTPKYNLVYGKYITTAIFTLLIGYSLLEGMHISLSKYILYLLVVLVAVHAVLTSIKLKQKKRPVSDASIYFWFLGMAGLILFSILYILGVSKVLNAIAFGVFALSIVFAMSYKIVPFLVWFHLNAKGYLDAPMMHEVVSPKYAKINFLIFLSSAISLILSYKFTIIFYFGSFLLLLSFSMLSYAIYSGLEKYDYILKNGKKFDFNFN